MTPIFLLFLLTIIGICILPVIFNLIERKIKQRIKNVHEFMMNVVLEKASNSHDKKWLTDTFFNETQYWRMILKFWKPLKLESWWSPEEIQKLHSGGGNQLKMLSMIAFLFLSKLRTHISILFIEKVSKLLGSGKLVRFAHLISFSHLTQTVPSPQAPGVHSYEQFLKKISSSLP